MAVAYADNLALVDDLLSLSALVVNVGRGVVCLQRSLNIALEKT